MVSSCTAFVARLFHGMSPLFQELRSCQQTALLFLRSFACCMGCVCSPKGSPGGP